jgi:hypothetical protein
MAHDHAHTHDSTYYLDQLCTIASCGALGGVAILMYWLPGPDGKPKLSHILAEQFFTPVLIGGITLIVLAIIRAITLWQTAGQHAGHAHDHHHDHDHDHGHDHAHDHHDHDHDHDHAHHHAHHHHDHAHGHGHEHGWTPARYAVLMLPIVLYFLNLPNSTFSQEWFSKHMEGGKIEGSDPNVKAKEGLVLGFKELANAAYYPKTREAMEGQTGKLTGMFSPISAKEFTLFRVKMTCCAADAIPVEVRIVCDENITTVNPKDWVEVEGQIQFRKLVGRDKYLPVLYLKSADQVKRIPPQSDYGLE